MLRPGMFGFSPHRRNDERQFGVMTQAAPDLDCQSEQTCLCRHSPSNCNIAVYKIIATLSIEYVSW